MATIQVNKYYNVVINLKAYEEWVNWLQWKFAWTFAAALNMQLPFQCSLPKKRISLPQEASQAKNGPNK